MGQVLTLSDLFEENLKDAATALAEEIFKLAGEHGDRPPFRPEWPDELQAAQYLSGWYIYGNAEGEVQEKYWDDILDGVDYVTGEVNINAGPKDAIEYNRRMWRFWHEPLLLKVAMLACTDEEAEDYQFMLQEGYHYGHLKPNLEEYIKSRSYDEDKARAPVIPFETLMQAAAERFGPPAPLLQGPPGLAPAPDLSVPAPLASVQGPDLRDVYTRMGNRAA